MNRKRPARGIFRTLCVWCGWMLFSLGSASWASERPAEAMRYTVRFPAAYSHYVEIEALVPTGMRPEIELMMPVWSPGSYRIYDFSRNVERLRAETLTATPLRVRKSRKNRWVVQTDREARIMVRYRLYAHEMSTEANWVDEEFALLNGAGTFLTLAESVPRQHEIEIILPESWTQVATPLSQMPGSRPQHYVAPDFDTLVDSPIIAGNPAVYEFPVDGKPHYLVTVGAGPFWDVQKSLRDLPVLVRTHGRFWGVLPYESYWFLNVLSGVGGGLEHRQSTLMMGSRWRTRTPKDYAGWLQTVSHEFFHAWNVKRLRPVELGPFDYDSEVYSRGLWVAEGFTAYYGPLLVKRAGLGTEEDYLERLSDEIEELQTTPGRFVRTLEKASFDAWLKHYHKDENYVNSSISYYTKGAVTAFLLDAKVRRATANAHSLDDVMRLAYARYSGKRGFTEEEFRSVAAEVAGIDLGAWFDKALQTTEELNYEEALEWFGLSFRAAAKTSPGGWLGATVALKEGRIVIKEVPHGVPAFEAGLNVGDEIIAIGDYRVRPDEWESRLKAYRPGEKVEVLVARRDKLLRMPLTFGSAPTALWRLEPDPNATEEQKARRRAWLEGAHRGANALLFGATE